MVEVNDRTLSYDVDDDALAAFNLDPRTPLRLLAELRGRDGLHALFLVCPERLLGRDINHSLGADLFTYQLVLKADDDVVAPQTDGDRTVLCPRVVDPLFLCVLLIGGIEDILTGAAGVSEPDKISFMKCHANHLDSRCITVPVRLPYRSVACLHLVVPLYLDGMVFILSTGTSRRASTPAED